MELTSVPLNSPEDLIQQAKNLKASSLGSWVRGEKNVYLDVLKHQYNHQSVTAFA